VDLACHARRMAQDLRAEDAPFDGRWWSPEDPDAVVGGRLGVENDTWWLTLFGWIGPWDPAARTQDRPSVLHGEVAGHPVSLLRLAPGGWAGSGFPGQAKPPYTCRYAANLVVGGAFVLPDTRYAQASVRFVNLNEWLNRRPWSHEPSVEGDHWRQTFVYSDPGELEVPVDGADFRIGRSLGWTDNLERLRVTSDEWISMRFASPLDIDTVEHEYIRPLQNLLELATGSRSATIRLQVIRPGDERLAKSAAVLSAAPPSEITEPVRPWQMLFYHGEVTVPACIKQWWRVQADLGIVTDVLSALYGRGYVGNHFMNAATAIEGYHRHTEGRVRSSPQHRAKLSRILGGTPSEDRAWLAEKLAHSHEPTFAERVDGVLEKAGAEFASSIGDPAQWRDWIKRGRNGVAHRDPDMIDVDKEWEKTIRITESIQLLMRIVLIKDIGVPDSVLMGGLARTRVLDLVRLHLGQVFPTWFGE
jgi:hypothetical protein